MSLILLGLLANAGIPVVTFSQRRRLYQLRSRLAHIEPAKYSRVRPVAHIHLQTADVSELAPAFRNAAAKGTAEGVTYAWGA